MFDVCNIIHNIWILATYYIVGQDPPAEAALTAAEPPEPPSNLHSKGQIRERAKKNIKLVDA